jgi:Flp pilus assembly pilin Flp
MMRRLRENESGLTLIELLMAAAMSVVIVGAGASMLISAVRKQPELSERSQKVTEVRFVQERMTKELRNGIRVDEATPTTVSFVTRVRTSACGGGGVALEPEDPAIDCQVTYDCSSGSVCTRAEAAEGMVGGGTPKPLVGDLESGAVFDYFPNSEEPTYVGMIFRITNPSGSGSLTVSDGASLRTTVLDSSG